MFEYLKKFVNPQGRTIEVWHENVFIWVKESELAEVENRLGFRIPDQLRQFYLEIGFGNLTTPENPTKNYKFYGENEIIPPYSIADIMLLGHDSGLISQDVLDSLQPGDMPFFHISDSCLYLVMRPLSEKPNAVYNQWGDLVEENFESFIWRLYHEDPSFYENVKG